MDEQERRAAALVAASTTAAAIFDASPEQVVDLAGRYLSWIETGALGEQGEPVTTDRPRRQAEGLPTPKTLAENPDMRNRLKDHAAERRRRKEADRLAEAAALSSAGEGGQRGGA